MKMVNHPHDKLFKETFGDLEVTSDFINQYLPKEILDIIDVESLTSIKDSFIQEELKDSYSDLLFNVKIGDEEGYLYFLFEHKSYQALDISFQLLGYMLQIWNQKLIKEKTTTLPIIIPLLFYHGEKRWNNTKTVGDWITGYEKFPQTIQKYVPNFEFIFYDFSFNSEEEIKGDIKLRAYLELSKHIFVKDMTSLIAVIITIEELLSRYDPLYFDTVMIYLLSTRDDIPVETLQEQLTTEGRNRVMSIAEQLRVEGRKEGKKERVREVARKMLLLNMDQEQIIEITNLSKKEIEEIKKEI